MRTTVAALLLIALLLPACAGRKNYARGTDLSSSSAQGSFSNPGLIVTPANTLSGRVITVNGSARFVVLSFPVGRMPSLEQRLAVYHGSLKAGEVKITGPQRDDKIVADLVIGEAVVGDEVRGQ
jgi:hypothetical protein